MLTVTAKRRHQEFLEVLRGYDRSSYVKVGTLGGDGRDSDFESSFSNIAHAFMRERAPTLQQYEVGFQLLDRNQENTKACGVFGFKVGPQWLFAPVMFLNGDLKGHELLYIKNEDQFVPLKENWLDVVLQKKPNVLGEPVDRSPWRHGITAPNLQSFSRSPSKMASAIAEDMLPGVAAFSYFATQNPYSDPKYAKPLDIPTFLRKEGKVVIAKLCQTMLHYPKLASAFDKTYGGLGIIREAIDACHQEGGVLGKSAAESCSSSPLMITAPRKTPKLAPSGVMGSAAKVDHMKSGALDFFTRESRQDRLDLLSSTEKEPLLRDEIGRASCR